MGGIVTVTVQANSPDFPWTVMERLPWIGAYTYNSHYTGSRAVVIQVNANQSKQPRCGAVTIAGQAVLITQD